LDQRRHVALACDLGLGRIGRIATLTEPWVSFTVGEGQLFGFIGPNGTGKTRL
jgi:ABC-type polysaccharide/polyol phosphate transport system ATPase subunit